MSRAVHSVVRGGRHPAGIMRFVRKGRDDCRVPPPCPAAELQEEP